MENLLEKFVVFVISHENPYNIRTLKTIKAKGYTGNWLILIDDKDKYLDEYIKLYGKDKIAIYNKEEVALYTDEMNNFKDRKCILFARNACFDIAKKLGYQYFCELDEDYTDFRYRYEINGMLSSLHIENLTEIFNEMLKYLDSNKNITTIAFCQGGDLIGGTESRVWVKQLSRKAMNSFICDINRRFDFRGVLNDDVNTYCILGQQGQLFFTLACVQLDQEGSQQKQTGITEMYKATGTYQKSFYSVMLCPSFVRISMMGCGHPRIHHNIDWEHGVPKIISSKYKKRRIPNNG